jgi:hypothetical protein
MYVCTECLHNVKAHGGCIKYAEDDVNARK